MQVSIKGSVSNEVNSGEVVTITVTHPDETQETITTTTDDSGQFTTSVDEVPGTGYSAQAHIDADAEYQDADSSVVTFDVNKGPRTLVLQVG